MTKQLKQLSEAATQGDWIVNQRAMFSVEAPERRGICSTGGYSNNRRDGEELFAENVANAAFIATLVNAYRAGELVPAEEARAREAAVQVLMMDEVGFLLNFIDKLMEPEDGGVSMHAQGQTPDWFVRAAYISCYGCSPDHADHTTTALEQIKQETRDEGKREAADIAAKYIPSIPHDGPTDAAQEAEYMMAGHIRNAILAALSEPKEGHPLSADDSVNDAATDEIFGAIAQEENSEPSR